MARKLVQQIPIAFPNGRGYTLRGMLYIPTKYSTAVLCAHGYPGDSSGNTHRRAQELARHGYLFMRFDFTGCGASDGKHEERLMSGDISDIRAAVDFLSAHSEYDKLVLFGHSTGAVTVPFVANDKRVGAVILSGGQAYLDQGARFDFTDRQVRELWMKGYTYTSHPLSWSGKNERIVKKFYDEFFTLNLPRALKSIRKPTLVIHGECDEAVPLQCARDAYAQLKAPKRLVVVSRADHRFIINSKEYYAGLLAFLRSFSRLAKRTAAPRARDASSTK